MHITRKELIDLAFKALDEFPSCPAEDRNHMLYAACTMQSVAANAWIIDAHCGCLVGTMLLNEGLSVPTIASAADHGFEGFRSDSGVLLYEIGLKFDGLLRVYLTARWGEVGRGEKNAVEVID